MLLHHLHADACPCKPAAAGHLMLLLPSLQGDACPYAHGVYECWLHPAKYRTQLCKDGGQCRRPVCFFAHSVAQLRSPTYTWEQTSDVGPLLHTPCLPVLLWAGRSPA